MGPYLLLLVATLLMAVLHAKPQWVGIDKIRPGPAWPLFFLILWLMIGFRQEVGNDWWGYIDDIEYMQGEPLDAIFSNDPAFELLNWIGANLGGGIYFTNLISSAIFCWGLFAFCRTEPRPWLALLVAIPYLVIVVAMGYPRQSVAIGLAMLALVHLSKGSGRRFLIFILLAALFHKSAIILTPLIIFVGSKQWWIKIVGLVVSVLLVLILLILGTFDYLASSYIATQHEASGAAIRVTLIVIPAVLFIAFEKRFRFTRNRKVLWKWMSWGALLFVPLLIFFPSSSAVDRLALYMIPLQLTVLSRIPDVFGTTGHRNYPWIFLISIYSASIMMVWLLFADHASYHLPYQFYPWEAVWE